MLAHRHVEVLRCTSCRQACDSALLAKVDAVVVTLGTGEHAPEHLERELGLLADALIARRLKGIIILADSNADPNLDGDAFMTVNAELSADELWGRVATVRHYRPRLLAMDQHMAVMQKLGKKLNQQFVEVDQELRLASRLQRDFLPKSLPEIGDIRFATVYRPATWVSGDVYDVTRLDETHIGLYLADAVGHGIAAGLLTMFIKQAVVGKKIHDEGYTIVPPSDVLGVLNTELARQELPNCQFVTACYAVIDTATHQITFARGGHPHPIHVTADGHCSEIRTVGGLLGVFADETYPSTTLCLGPGEKLIIYSDGLEDAIIGDRSLKGSDDMFTPMFREVVRRPVNACLEGITDAVDDTDGSISPEDDMTIVALERTA